MIFSTSPSISLCVWEPHHLLCFLLCPPSSVQGQHLICCQFVRIKIWVLSASAVHCRSSLLLPNLLLTMIWLPSEESVHWSIASILPPPLFHSCNFNVIMLLPQSLFSLNLLSITFWLPFEDSVHWSTAAILPLQSFHSHYFKLHSLLLNNIPHPPPYCYCHQPHLLCKLSGLWRNSWICFWGLSLVSLDHSVPS